MPAEHFSFRPTPEVRTYAELFAHIIDTQIYFCNLVKGGANPIAGKNLEKSVTDKAGVVQMVKEGFAYCDDVFAGLTDEKLATMLTAGDRAEDLPDRRRESGDDGGRARQRALRKSRDLYAVEGDCAPLIRAIARAVRSTTHWRIDMKNLCVPVFAASLMSATFAGAQPPPPPPAATVKPRPPQSFPAYLQAQYATLKTNLMGSAEKMPADQFAFKPTPDVRTYGQLFGHTMAAQYSYCSR